MPMHTAKTLRMELDCGKLGSIIEALKDFGTTYGIPIGQRVYFCCISVDLSILYCWSKCRSSGLISEI